ncbi:MAG: PQQ-binding-like beta-propeller repeat protein [Acidobacteria bacterium]|nr:PQQ-binding-like beta-propeller repeat protein [Acidobacteriota bacterium]
MMLSLFLPRNKYPLILMFGLTLLILVPTFCYRATAQISLSRPLIERWHYEMDRTVNFPPAISKERIYLPLTTGTLLSLRTLDGNLNWRAEIGGEISAGLVADERGVYIASETQASATYFPQSTGALRAIGSQSGITLWMRTLQAPIRGALVSNETTLFGGASDGRLYAVAKQTGELLWINQHKSPFLCPPLLSKDHLYIGDERGSFLDINQSTGRVIWRYQTRGAIRATVAVANQIIFLGSSDGYVYALDERTHRLRWRVRMGGSVQSIVPTEKGLIVSSLDNFVYNLTYGKGDKLWKRQLAGRIIAQPLAIGDSVIFAPLAGDECVILDLRDGKKLNSLPVGEDGNTAASPVLAGNLLLLTTRRGLKAYTNVLTEDHE